MWLTNERRKFMLILQLKTLQSGSVYLPTLTQQTHLLHTLTALPPLPPPHCLLRALPLCPIPLHTLQFPIHLTPSSQWPTCQKKTPYPRYMTSRRIEGTKGCCAGHSIYVCNYALAPVVRNGPLAYCFSNRPVHSFLIPGVVNLRVQRWRISPPASYQTKCLLCPASPHKSGKFRGGALDHEGEE